MKDFVTKVKTVGLSNFELADISQQDLEHFVNCLKDVQALTKSYSTSYTRKQAAEEICKKITPIETFLWLTQDRLKGLKSSLEHSDEFVNDTYLAMGLILRLANTLGEQYVLKTLYTSDFCSQETKHGDKEYSKADGTIWIIGSKNIVETIKDKMYYGSELSTELTNIVANGDELIVCTNHYFVSNVVPFKYSAKLEIFQIRTSGLTSDIKCYVRDGALQDAVTLFRSYITNNGGDISGLNQDKLYEIIRNG